MQLRKDRVSETANIPELREYRYYQYPEERRRLKAAITRVCEFAHDRKVSTVVALDRSGRHAGQFFRWAWKSLYPGEKVPDVFFMPPEYLADGIRGIVAPRKGRSPFAPLGYTDALDRVAEAKADGQGISEHLKRGHDEYRERIKPLLETLQAQHSHLHQGLLPSEGEAEPIMLLDEYAETGFHSPMMWLKPFFSDLGIETHAALLFYVERPDAARHFPGWKRPEYLDCIGGEGMIPRWHRDVVDSYHHGILTHVKGLGPRKGQGLLGVQSRRTSPVSHVDTEGMDREFMELSRNELKMMAQELKPVTQSPTS